MDRYNDGVIDLIWVLQILIIVAFVTLLIMAIMLLSNFYIADNHNCKSYDDAAKVGEIGSREHTIELTNCLLSDGIWPIAYICSSISAGFIVFGLGIQATIQNILIIFLFTFIPYYAILLFVYHHYVQVLKNTINEYVSKSTPGLVDENIKDCNDENINNNDNDNK